MPGKADIGTTMARTSRGEAFRSAGPCREARRRAVFGRPALRRSRAPGRGGRRGEAASVVPSLALRRCCSSRVHARSRRNRPGPSSDTPSASPSDVETRLAEDALAAPRTITSGGGSHWTSWDDISGVYLLSRRHPDPRAGGVTTSIRCDWCDVACRRLEDTSRVSPRSVGPPRKTGCARPTARCAGGRRPGTRAYLDAREGLWMANSRCKQALATVSKFARSISMWRRRRPHRPGMPLRVSSPMLSGTCGVLGELIAVGV